MAGMEAHQNDITHALATISGNFDRGVSREVLFAELSIRHPGYPCYVVRDPNSPAIWIASSRTFHEGLATYYREVLADRGEIGKLQTHLGLLDEVLETDRAADRRLAGQQLWFYKTPGERTAVELESLVGLRRSAVNSAMWTIRLDRAAHILVNMAAEQAKGVR